MQKFLGIFLILTTSISMAAAPVDTKPECQNKAFEVNGQIHPVIQGYYSFYGDETLRAIEWIESLQSIEACTIVVTKAESRFKRLDFFTQEAQKFPEPYKSYFEKQLTATKTKNGQMVKVKIVQQQVDELVNTGISASEACAVVYGQWSWAAINSSATFSNRMNNELSECKNPPLKVHHVPNPSFKRDALKHAP